jgi:hypothetical protein
MAIVLLISWFFYFEPVRVLSARITPVLIS